MIYASQAAHNLRAFYNDYDQNHKEDYRPICYEVVAYKTESDFQLGKIVTPLLLEEWCKIHHYLKVEVRGLPRPARKDEVTDLK